jgi:hypothetical protein
MQLLVIEVLASVEIFGLADPAERLEDEAVAVRSRGVNVVSEIVLPDDFHALEREIHDLGMRRRGRGEFFRWNDRRPAGGIRTWYCLGGE